MNLFLFPWELHGPVPVPGGALRGPIPVPGGGCVDLFLFLEGAVWICIAQQESIVKVLVFIAYLPVR